MKAEWSDETHESICLCCGQIAPLRMNRVTPEEAVARFELLEALGFTRESLLTKHRAQLEWQLPGLAEWLQGQ